MMYATAGIDDRGWVEVQNGRVQRTEDRPQ